jgi:YVTN family beta-propeller protein
MMRALVLVALVALLVGCVGSADDVPTTVTTPTGSVMATMAATSPAATPTSTVISQVTSTTSAERTATPTDTPEPTPTHTPEPSPTATEVSPTPIVVGKPGTDLPRAGQITATVPVGVRPLAVAAGHGAIWVQNDMDGTLSRIDPTTNEVVATIQIATPLDPASPPDEFIGMRQGLPGLAIDARFVWATKPFEQAVVQVDPQTNTIVAAIPLPANPTSIAVHEDALWVALFGASSVVRVDTTTREVVATIPSVPAPAGIAVGQDAVWVANHFSDSVTRIDPSTNAVVGQISLRWQSAPMTGFECSLCASEVVANEYGVWIRLWRASTIVRVDPAANRLAAVIPVGIEPRSMASSARGIWVGHMSTAGVLLIDPATNHVVASVPAPDAPNQLPAVAVWEDVLWVARVATNDVVSIELQR